VIAAQVGKVPPRPIDHGGTAMTEPKPDQPGREALQAAADPTRKVARPPVPGRAVREQMAAGDLHTPPYREDDPTLALDEPRARTPHRTLEFGTPAPVKVTVGRREKPRRRHRPGPWIAAVVFALVIRGIVLVVLQLNGETIDADVDLVGWGAALRAGTGLPPA